MSPEPRAKSKHDTKKAIEAPGNDGQRDPAIAGTRRCSPIPVTRLGRDKCEPSRMQEGRTNDTSVNRQRRQPTDCAHSRREESSGLRRSAKKDEILKSRCVRNRTKRRGNRDTSKAKSHSANPWRVLRKQSSIGKADDKGKEDERNLQEGLERSIKNQQSKQKGGKEDKKGHSLHLPDPGSKEQKQSSGLTESANRMKQKEKKEHYLGENPPQQAYSLHLKFLNQYKRLKRRRRKQWWRNEPKWKSANETKQLSHGKNLKEKWTEGETHGKHSTKKEET